MNFSEKNQAFYANDIDYPNLPDDVIDVGDEYQSLYQAINSGCYVYVDNGNPVASDARPSAYHAWDKKKNAWVITKDAASKLNADQQSLAESHKKVLIESAMNSVNVIQLKSQMGRSLTDEEKNKVNGVLDYIDAVNAVDLSAAPNIEWPELN